MHRRCGRTYVYGGIGIHAHMYVTLQAYRPCVSKCMCMYLCICIHEWKEICTFPIRGLPMLACVHVHMHTAMHNFMHRWIHRHVRMGSLRHSLSLVVGVLRATLSYCIPYVWSPRNNISWCSSNPPNHSDKQTYGIVIRNFPWQLEMISPRPLRAFTPIWKTCQIPWDTFKGSHASPEHYHEAPGGGVWRMVFKHLRPLTILPPPQFGGDSLRTSERNGS